MREIIDVAILVLVELEANPWGSRSADFIAVQRLKFTIFQSSSSESPGVILGMAPGIRQRVLVFNVSRISLSKKSSIIIFSIRLESEISKQKLGARGISHFFLLACDACRPCSPLAEPHIHARQCPADRHRYQFGYDCSLFSCPCDFIYSFYNLIFYALCYCLQTTFRTSIAPGCHMRDYILPHYQFTIWAICMHAICIL